VIRLTLAEVAHAVGGRLDGGADPASAVTAAPVVDSRRAGPGTLFVAVRGDRVDGHDFAPAALAAGAVAVLAAAPLGRPAVVVDDVVEGLGRLAAEVLRRLPGLHVVGVTGSSGKTTTKDLLAAVLAADGPTVAASDSFNNEIGLPLTACAADGDTRYLVLEYSARGRGHISYLTGIARPDVAVVLNVGDAHVGEFGSRDAIATAKAELVEGLAADGTAVLNADDPLVSAMAARAPGRVVTFGLGAGALVRAGKVTLDECGRPGFGLRSGDGSPVPVRLGYVGAHQVPNALAAAAAAGVLGLPLLAIAAALSDARPVSRWRMELRELPRRILLLNDAYNANPDSVRAALTTLTHLRGQGAGQRRGWAVLGEMLELGPYGAQAHADVGRLAVALGVDRIVAVGDGAAGIDTAARAAGGRSIRVADADEAATLLAAELGPGDVVLVKASRRVGLERVAAALENLS